MSSLDMSLEDLAKSKRSSASSSSAPRGGRGGSRGGRGGGRREDDRDGGALRKERYSSGAQSQRQEKPYQRQPRAAAYIPAAVQYVAPIQPLAYAPSNSAKWTNDLYSGPQQPQQQAEPIKKLQGDTIHVSNLAPDVTDDDVREIFERIGTVKSCTVNYNSSGQSTGTATVTFSRKDHAEKAVQDYDEAEVDGRTMKLKLVGSIVSTPVVVQKKKPQVQVQQQQLAYIQPQQLQYQQPYVQQFAQPLQAQYREREPRREREPKSVVSRGGSGPKPARGGRGGASSGGAAPARGGATRGGRGGRGGAKKEVTGADLDSEMDAYHSTKTVAAAAAPASDAPVSAGQPTSV